MSAPSKTASELNSVGQYAVPLVQVLCPSPITPWTKTMSVVTLGDCRTKCDGGCAVAFVPPIGINDNTATVSTSFQLVIVPPNNKAIRCNTSYGRNWKNSIPKLDLRRLLGVWRRRLC